MSRTGLNRVRSLVALAAAAGLACALPSIAAADPPHARHFGGHFAGHEGGRARVRGFSGGHRPERASGGDHWHGTTGGEGHWHAGFAPRADWHGDPRRGGDWERGHWHAGWDGDHWRAHDWDGRWHGDDWRGDWHDPYWRGGVWVGGDWDGMYWPPVDYDWDYPWFLPAVPYGAATIWFGSVPYYYVNRVYYVWSPSYDGYVVADPPPVAAPAQRPPAGTGQSTSGVLSLRLIPLKGQNRQQTASDRYACHQWAVAQSGFNPISPAQDAHASAAARSGYRRALTACLNARGYKVQ